MLYVNFDKNKTTMNCPIDSTVLHISERNEIEVDYCPKYQGLCLDRGVPDKIPERANTLYTPSKKYLYSRESRMKKSLFDNPLDF